MHKIEDRENDRTKALLRRFEMPLLQFATRITGDRERARDILQETFVKYQRNGAASQNPEPTTWLFTVCRNGALNVCRKEKRMLHLDIKRIWKMALRSSGTSDQNLEYLDFDEYPLFYALLGYAIQFGSIQERSYLGF